jgi:hypothetical protein
MEAAESRRQSKPLEILTPEQQVIAKERGLLELSRVRLQQQIKDSTHDRYRRILASALDDVDRKLAALNSPAPPAR